MAKKSKKSIDLSELLITDKYGFGSFLKDNIVPAAKLGAGLALGPAGVPLAVSGGADLAGNIAGEATDDPNAQALAQVGGQAANIALANPQLENGGDLTEYNGNTHEDGGIPIGGSAEVEDKETRWEDYIFSEKLKVPGKKYSFSDASKRIDSKYNKRKNDKYDTKAKEREMKALMGIQESERERLDLSHKEKMNEMFGCGGKMEYPNGGVIPDQGQITSMINYANQTQVDPTQLDPAMQGNVETTDANTPWYLDPTQGTYENTVNNQQAAAPPPVPSQARQEVSPGIVYEDGELKIRRTDNTGNVRYQTANPKMAALHVKGQKGLQGDLTHNQLMEGFTQDPQGMISTLFPAPAVHENGGPLEYENGGGLTLDQFQAANQAVNPEIEALANYVGNRGSLVGQPSYTTSPEPSIEGTTGYTQSPVREDATPTSDTGTSGTSGADLALLLAQNAGNIGNTILGMQGADPVNVGRVNPAQVSYQQALDNVRKGYDQAANVARESIRKSATSSGQTLSNQIAANTSLTKDKAQQMAQISEQEQNVNAQSRAQAEARNQQAQIREEDLTQRGKGAQQQALMAGLSGIGTSIAGFTRDQKANKMQQQYIQNLLNTGEYKINPQTRAIEYIGNQEG